MNIISQTIIDYWHRGARTKTSPNGWISRNSPCCHNRGESQDKRGRGGLKVDPTSGMVSTHCFNCSFTASYMPGRTLYPKMIKLLEWLGCDEATLNKLKLESLREVDSSNISKRTFSPRPIKEIEKMPISYILSDNINKFPAHVEFLKTRGFDPEDFPFLASDDLGYKHRVIIPFILSDTMVGYSARSINPNDKNRYIMRTTCDYIFGLDFIEDEHTWVVLTEGVLDAISIKGLAVLHNEINDAQVELICDTKKKIVVVPDLDKAGVSNNKNSLIQTALDNNWAVSFPEWNKKDLNAAYVSYGELFCLTHILKTSTSDEFTIRLKQKLLMNKFKK